MQAHKSSFLNTIFPHLLFIDILYHKFSKKSKKEELKAPPFCLYLLCNNENLYNTQGFLLAIDGGYLNEVYIHQRLHALAPYLILNSDILNKYRSHNVDISAYTASP